MKALYAVPERFPKCYKCGGEMEYIGTVNEYPRPVGSYRCKKCHISTYDRSIKIEFILEE